MGLKINPFTGQLDLTGSGGGGGATTASRYTSVFNNTTDWGSPSGGFYTITITQATHGKTTNPTMMIFELDTGNYIKIDVDRVSVNPSGDISLRVPDSPDLRFSGKIIII